LLNRLQKDCAKRVIFYNPIVHKRSVIVKFLLLPSAFFMGIFGWSLYWIGSRKWKAITRRSIGVGELTLSEQSPEQEIAV
jgi:hypothetical protein